MRILRAIVVAVVLGVPAAGCVAYSEPAPYPAYAYYEPTPAVVFSYDGGYYHGYHHWR